MGRAHEYRFDALHLRRFGFTRLSTFGLFAGPGDLFGQAAQTDGAAPAAAARSPSGASHSAGANHASPLPEENRSP